MNELQTLARCINQREEIIQIGKQRTLESANATGAAVLEQGRDLIKAKSKAPHGEWLTWLREHCPKVSPRMAQLYMRAASNTKRVSHLPEANSLRSALALLDEDQPSTEPKETKRWPPHIEAMTRASKLAGYVTRFPISRFPDEIVERLRDDLEPVARQLWPDKFGKVKS